MTRSIAARDAANIALYVPSRGFQERPLPALRRTMVAGGMAILLFVGGFLAWAFTSRLDSAAVAAGVVIVDSHRKTVQHLEGGILRELAVKEGQAVRAGDVLLRMDTTQADAITAQIDSQRLTNIARMARLRAERAGQKTLEFPPELTGRQSEPAIREMLAAEQQLFKARWQSYEGQVAVLRSRIEQFQTEIKGGQVLLASTRERLGYVNDELASVRKLYAQGYERRPRLLELQRVAAELAGRDGEISGTLARAREGIAGTELEILGAMNTRQAEIAKDMQEAQALDADLNERLRAASDVLKRKDVIAPQDGLVVDLKFFTPGGVIGPGQPILDIVPQNDDLIVEAKVNPIDIDVVRVGLSAQVRLTAYKQRRVPLIAGEVIYVSADKLIDQRDGSPYFLTRIKLSREALSEVPDIALYPGMPTEVYIVTGERRAVDYFISPVTDSFRRAFTEQ